MKNLNLLLAILIGATLFSCSSDDDNTTEENPEINSKFTISGTEYTTPNGYIISYFDGVNNSSHATFE